ncbi:MAG: hypothetical protein H0U61_01040 [Nocardioidaceae bacterium]|jgi:hypothetical protein|nr:hypothetical protein [Nocardioidaceae bacterium]
MSDQQQYPQYPEDSARSDRDAYVASTEQPPSMKTAVMLMRVGAGLSLVGIIVGLLTLGALKDDVRQQLRDSGSAFTQSDVDSIFGVAVGFIVVIGLIGAALWLWMASANGKGKSWARIVATVLGVINVLSFLYQVSAGNQTVVSLIIGALNVIVGVAALVFLYKSDSSAYYQANSRR